MDYFELFARQHGVISRAQAFEAGLTRHDIAGLMRRGEWVAIYRGVYRHRAVQQSWHGSLVAACLRTGGVASHRCAAALWGIDGFRSPRTEIVVPMGCSGRNVDALVHHSTQWDRIDRVVRDGVATTGLVRTVVDLGAVVPLRRLETAAESAMRVHQIDWSDLRGGLIRHSRRGRDGCGRLRVLLEARHGSGELPRSDWSRLVANILVDAGLPSPQLEFPVTGPGGAVLAEVDLAWPDQRVVVELDSVRWHLNRKSFERDRARRNRLRVLGWTVLEVTWAQTIGARPAFIRMIRSALGF